MQWKSGLSKRLRWDCVRTGKNHCTLSFTTASYYDANDLQELSVATIKQEESNILDEVEDEKKKVTVEYEADQNEVDKIKAAGGTVSKELKKRKYDKVVWPSGIFYASKTLPTSHYFSRALQSPT